MRGVISEVSKNKASLSRRRRQWTSLFFAGFLALPLAMPSSVQAGFFENNKSLSVSQLPSFADLAQKVTPAVVSIKVTEEAEETETTSTYPQFSFPPGSPFEKFFRQFQPKEDKKTFKRKRFAQGSGFVISSDGYIVTNNHVVKGAEEIDIVFKDGTELPAKLIGKDAKTDLALLKVEAKKPLPFVNFDKKDNVRVGDWVMAVGNPFGLGGTVTVGIVSARARYIGAGPYDDFLQIDAPINRGNSGGPTFNMKGEVIGVNTAIYTPSGGNVGIGFAIPSTVASKVIGELKEHGKIIRGWLGVTIQPLTKTIVESLGLASKNGALVSNIIDDSPAAKAHFKVGDVITKINGIDIKDARDLSRVVADLAPHSKNDMTILRDGKSMVLHVTLGVYPDKLGPFQSEGDEQIARENSALIGSMLGLNLAKTDQGIVVKEVLSGSEAERQGIMPGDLIVKIRGVPVKSMRDIVRVLTKEKEDHAISTILLIRGPRGQRFVGLALPGKDANDDKDNQ